MLTDFLYLVSFIVYIVYVYNKFIALKKKGHPPSAKPYPVFGNGYRVLQCKDEKDLVRIVHNYVKRIGSPATFYMGPWITVVAVNKPHQLEAIIKSQKAKEKPPFFYEKLSFLKDGLVTLPDKTWRIHRKLLQPCYHNKLLEVFMPIFNRNSRKMCVRLEKFVDKGSFLCEPPISFKALSQVLETMLDVNAENVGDNLIETIVKETDDETTTICRRFVNILKDWMFPVTEEGRRSAKRMKTWDAFIDRIIELKYKSKEKYIKEFGEEPGESSSKFFERANTLSNRYMRMELMTVCLAGFATTGTAEAYTFVLLGMFQEVQEKVYQEIYSLYGDSDRDMQYEDLQHLVYLEQVIKESLRLFPPVPHIIRGVTEDMPLDNYMVSKGTSILVLINQIHRDPEIWEHPDTFYPEHFTPEKSSKRHPYAFVPFSAGPRNCMGYRYAFAAMKVTLTTVLRNFIIETDMKLSDLGVTRTFTLHTSHLNVRLRRRK